MRLIDRDALLEELNDKNVTTFSALIEEQRTIAFYVYFKIVNAIEKMPTIEALEKRNEPIEPIKPEELWICGACGGGTVGWDDWIGDVTRYNYCPICGQAVKWE